MNLFSTVRRLVCGAVAPKPVPWLEPNADCSADIALYAVADAQRRGKTVAIIDAENSLDFDTARSFGVNLDELVISQPSCGEEAFAICEHLLRTEAVDTLVFDSVSSLAPRSIVEGEFGDEFRELTPRMLSSASRRLRPVLRRSRTRCLFVNRREVSS